MDVDKGYCTKTATTASTALARNTLLPRTGTPITPIPLPSRGLTFYIQTSWILWLRWILHNSLKNPHVAPGPAERRALALAEFKLIYWGPAREATKQRQQMPYTRSTTPSFTEPISSCSGTHTYSRKYLAATSHKAVFVVWPFRI